MLWFKVRTVRVFSRQVFSFGEFFYAIKYMCP